MLAACGSTYIDESLIESSTTVVETVDVTESDRTFSNTDVIDQSLNDLSDAIVENDGSADVMLATILESWAALRRRSRLTLRQSLRLLRGSILAELSVERRCWPTHRRRETLHRYCHSDQ